MSGWSNSPVSDLGFQSNRNSFDFHIRFGSLLFSLWSVRGNKANDAGRRNAHKSLIPSVLASHGSEAGDYDELLVSGAVTPAVAARMFLRHIQAIPDDCGWNTQSTESSPKTT